MKQARQESYKAFEKLASDFNSGQPTMSYNKKPSDMQSDGGKGSKNSNSSQGNNTTGGVESQGFNELIPLNLSEPLPTFPVDTLPPVMAEYVKAVAESVQAPIEMVGVCALGAVEIACRGRYPVSLPSGHIERPCLYVAPIAPPSERKSGVMDVVMKPLIEYENEYNKAHGGEVAQSRSAQKLLEGRIANAEHAAIKEKDVAKRQAAASELIELNNELAAFEPIEPLRLYGADVTPEKLAAMLKSQKGTFALVSAEGGGLFDNIGRYTDKGGLEIYLNGYSGDRVCVDRKNSDSIVIDNPALSLIAPCQPTVIADLFSDRQKTGRGLLSRILFVWCKSRVGSRGVNGQPCDKGVTDKYRDLCYSMLDAQTTGDIGFDDDGFQIYRDFHNEIEPQLKPDEGELAFMGDWAGKVCGTMARLAGLIHCVNAFADSDNPFADSGNPLNMPINADEAKAAVALAKFFLSHAKEVYSEQTDTPVMRNARHLWRRLNTLNALDVSKSRIYRATQNKRDFDLDASIDELERRGYIRLEVVRRGNADKPTTTIFINGLAK